MKKTLEILKNFFLTTTSIFFLVSVFIITVFSLVDEMESSAVLQFSLLTCALLFSLISGLVIALLGAVPKLNNVLRYALEFLLCYAAFYLTMFRMTGRGGMYSQIFALSTVFLIVYAASGGVVLLYRRAMGMSPKNEQPYESIYGGVAEKAGRENPTGEKKEQSEENAAPKEEQK